MPPRDRQIHRQLEASTVVAAKAARDARETQGRTARPILRTAAPSSSPQALPHLDTARPRTAAMLPRTSATADAPRSRARAADPTGRSSQDSTQPSAPARCATAAIACRPQPARIAVGPAASLMRVPTCRPAALSPRHASRPPARHPCQQPPASSASGRVTWPSPRPVDASQCPSHRAARPQIWEPAATRSWSSAASAGTPLTAARRVISHPTTNGSSSRVSTRVAMPADVSEPVAARSSDPVSSRPPSAGDTGRDSEPSRTPVPLRPCRSA
jgi:hypothetical protein